jgi:hypothetical protein
MMENPMNDLAASREYLPRLEFAKAAAAWGKKAERAGIAIGYLAIATVLLTIGFALAASTLALALVWFTGLEGAGQPLVGSGMLFLGTMRGTVWCWDRVRRKLTS